MSEARVRTATHGRVRVITLDNPPVNAIARGIPRAVIAALAEAGADRGIEAIVIHGAGRCFSAGADIREFGQRRDPGEPDLRALIAACERSETPVIAALHGFALGGGLELALGCHARLGAPDTRYGLPEVKIGLLPGAGGTQRLPRLIGVEAALDLCLSGVPIGTAEALRLGLLDAEIEGDLLAGALAFAARNAASGRWRRACGLDLDPGAVPAGFFAARREAAQKASPNLPAPPMIVDCIEIAATAPLAEGLEREREMFESLRASPQSKALIHVFFAEREAGKIAGLGPRTPVRTIERAGVVGAGTMGSGIALCFARAGIPVALVDSDPAGLARGLEAIEASLGRALARGSLAPQERDRCRTRIVASTALAAVADADIVIEAVYEEMALKTRLFAELSALCRADAILATNTSTLDVDALAAATAAPERVVGTHFFSPAHAMRLVEIVRARASAPETLASVLALARRLGKLPVVSGVCFGFIGNRMLYAYLRQAAFLVEEGAWPEEVDRALVGFGLPMGPFAMKDLAGLDVGYRIRKAHPHLRPAGARASAIEDLLVERGRLGQKTGRGWYRYEAGQRTPIPDPEVTRLIESESKRLGIVRRAIPEPEILERCLFALVNEGAKILDQGIAARAGDIDLVWINGYGFPAWRGGPMFHADRLGLDKVCAAVRRLHAAHGAWWEPAPLLERLAAAGGCFCDRERG